MEPAPASALSEQLLDLLLKYKNVSLAPFLQGFV